MGSDYKVNFNGHVCILLMPTTALRFLCVCVCVCVCVHIMCMCVYVRLMPVPYHAIIVFVGTQSSYSCIWGHNRDKRYMT